MRLKPWGERERTQQEIAKSIAPQHGGRPRRASPFRAIRPRSARARRDKPINFVIQTSRPYDELQQDGRRDARQGARLSRAWSIVDTDLKLN